MKVVGSITRHCIMGTKMSRHKCLGYLVDYSWRNLRDQEEKERVLYLLWIANDFMPVKENTPGCLLIPRDLQCQCHWQSELLL